MPKQVDHEARRHRIAQALWRVTSAHGLEGVSLRHIAAEAGVSMGQIQHYFRSKDDMLLFALDRMSRDVDVRVQERLSTLDRADEPAVLTRAVLVEMLPLDEQRRVEGLVTLAFLARAPFAPDIGDALTTGHDQLRDFLAEQLHAVGVRPDDARAHGIELVALLEGLTTLVLSGSMAAEAALAALDSRLTQAFDA